MTFSGALAGVNAALARARRSRRPRTTTAPTRSTITTDDLGNTGSGGALTDTDTVAITVRRSTTRRPAPTTRSASTRTAATRLPRADFGFSDPNDTPANAFASVVITTLPTGGTLELSNVAVTVGQEIDVDDLDDLVYTPAANANGSAYASSTSRSAMTAAPPSAASTSIPTRQHAELRHRSRQRRAGQQRAGCAEHERGHDPRLLDRQRQPRCRPPILMPAAATWR